MIRTATMASRALERAGQKVGAFCEKSEIRPDRYEAVAPLDITARVGFDGT